MLSSQSFFEIRIQLPTAILFIPGILKIGWLTVLSLTNTLAFKYFSINSVLFSKNNKNVLLMQS